MLTIYRGWKKSEESQFFEGWLYATLVLARNIPLEPNSTGKDRTPKDLTGRFIYYIFEVTFELNENSTISLNININASVSHPYHLPSYKDPEAAKTQI